MPEATPFQVMIVDDHPLMRRGVRQLLELDSGFEVVAEAGDGASAIDLANRLDIDVILLDLNMKGMSGLDTLNALRRDGVTAQIIILTVSDASSDVFALIDAGADGQCGCRACGCHSPCRHRPRQFHTDNPGTEPDRGCAKTTEVSHIPCGSGAFPPHRAAHGRPQRPPYIPTSYRRRCCARRAAAHFPPGPPTR